MKAQLEAIISRLDERDTLQPLSPRHVWDVELEQKIEALKDIADKASDTRLITLLSALHLRNDSVDIAHTYAQKVEHESTGAYWHGIIHRMEGDYSNAKYWFMRTGEHPVMNVVRQRTAAWLKSEADLAGVGSSHTREILQRFEVEGAWDAGTFVDLVAAQESAVTEGTEVTRHILEQIQHIEITELFNATMQAAMMT